MNWNLEGDLQKNQPFLVKKWLKMLIHWYGVKKTISHYLQINNFDSEVTIQAHTKSRLVKNSTDDFSY